MTHSMSSTLAPRLAIMLGRDTLTTLASSPDITVPSMTSASTLAG
jgi:hypothetical protein